MAQTDGYAHPELLIAPDALAAALLSSQPPLVIDLRPADRFARGQIAGAVHLDLWGVSLIDTDPAPLRAFLWMVRHQFELRGVDGRRPVVLCDEVSGLAAARAFWFLEYFGCQSVRVLDGGIAAWVREGHPVSTEPVAAVAATWDAAPTRDEMLATWRDALAAIGVQDCGILDTRSDEEYSGTVARAKRGGAMPGAIHVEWTKNLDAAGAFRTAAELRALYDGAGVTAGQSVLTYCQGGYRAAHSYLALRLLGYPDVRVYLGSWKEWGDRDDVPVVVPTRS